MALDEETLAELGMTAEQAQEIITPVAIGPTWSRNPDGSWLLPEHTLGWQIAGWCAEYLRAADGRGSWEFTPEQLRFLLWWYAVDEHGHWVYSSGVLQRLKGWGKDPLLAVMCLVEMVGPCRFGGWDDDGEPIAVPVRNPLVQVAAVDKAQTVNTMGAIKAYASEKLLRTYGIEMLEEMARAPGKRLECVTSNYRSLEGRRSTFVVLNETHHWISTNRGHQMYVTIDGNITKMGGQSSEAARYLCITNAYLPGEDSVAQQIREEWEAVQDGRAVDTGLLYDSLEAHPQAPLSGPLAVEVLKRIRGDAHWLDPDVILKSISKLSISPSRSRRMWLNQIVADEDALHGPETWDPLADRDATLLAGDEIVLGFDGGKSQDATALVAIRVRDRCAFLLHLQERPDTKESVDWTVNRARVNSAVEEAFRDYRVIGFFADVALWESHIADWTERFGEGLDVRSTQQNPIEWDMRRSQVTNTRAHERLVQSIMDGALRHDGDARLRRHVLNARRMPNNYGLYFGKETKDSSRKVDAYAALMLAHEALHRHRTTVTRVTKKGHSAGWFF